MGTEGYLLAAVWIGCVIAGVLVARRKRIDYSPALIATWLLGPIGLVWLLLQPDG